MAPFCIERFNIGKSLLYCFNVIFGSIVAIWYNSARIIFMYICFNALTLFGSVERFSYTRPSALKFKLPFLDIDKHLWCLQFLQIIDSKSRKIFNR